MANNNGTIGFSEAGNLKIQRAIQDYEKRIFEGIRSIKDNNDGIKAAFKGTNTERQIETLIKAIEDDLISYTASIMSSFESRVSKVKEGYMKQDSTSTAISDVTKSIKS